MNEFIQIMIHNSYYRETLVFIDVFSQYIKLYLQI